MDIKRITDKELVNYSPAEGEIVIVESTETNESFGLIYMNSKWNELSPQGGGSCGISLYDLNKQIIEQLPVISSEGFEDILRDFLKTEENSFYMLYGKEISYFTLFLTHSAEDATNFAKEIKMCVSNIRSFDYIRENHGIEIWGEVNNTLTCFYLFPYDAGVIAVS